jgi:nitrite reductase/ring-hydroxylating ferredoxin subunit
LLADPSAVAVRIEHAGQIVSALITRRGDRIAAFRNKCSHAGYPLQRADGAVVLQDSRYIVCAAHGASFTLERGECVGGPCKGEGLERIAIIVRDGAVYTA